MDGVELLGGRYRLVERLGGGGMSVIWRAYDEVLGRQVAVKVLASEGVDDASRDWIRAEAKAAARLSHPHITGVHDYGESRTATGDRLPYVVMELVNGPTLAERLAAGRLPVRTALLIGAQVAAALAAAHARGLVHRDVKPGNVMLSPAGAKVVDFGIAAVAGDRGESPSTGNVWGTPAYLAPERLAGGEVVPASDVYGLGLLLYRLLADAMPWRMETVSQMLRAHRYQEPAELPELPDVPDEVATACRRCLAKEPEERPTAAEVARVLAGASGWPLTSEPGDDEIVVGGALAAAAARAVDDAETGAETRVVPLIAPGARLATGRAAPVPPAQPHPRRHRTASSALVLLALFLLVGYCAAADQPRGRATPGAAAPAITRPATTDDATSGPRGASPDPTGAAVPAPAGATGGVPAPGHTTTPAGGGGPTGRGGGGGGGPTPVERTVTTPGGTVTARCTGPTATLVSWNPLPGVTPTAIDRGPGPSVGLVLHAALTDVNVGFRCVNGQPVATVS
jgi:serine/threonine-protein kinase